jgi:hypothetical protein
LFASEVDSMSSFVDKFVLLLTQCRWVRGCEGNVEIAFREALDGAVQQSPKGPI